jgi:hypothetical protein
MDDTAAVSSVMRCNTFGMLVLVTEHVFEMLLLE